MQLILTLILSIIIGFLFWCTGHLIRKELKITEDNGTLGFLINIGFGAALFLIIVNLVGNISKSFLFGLIASLVVIVGLMFWKLNDTKDIFSNLRELISSNKLVEIIKSNTNKYFWILLGAVNFIYGITAFSSVNLNKIGSGNTHIYNANQLINDVYPVKYFFLPSLDLRSHYGADIFAGTLSRITGANAEISFDILTMLFLNLCFFALYALTIKFLKSSEANKYLVPFGALLAWGPVTYLFTKEPGEVLPNGFIEKIVLITQSRLSDSANWSGLVLHWFFEPSYGMGCFFFLIAVYLVYKFFNDKQNLKFNLVLGVFLSSLIIIDTSKLVIIILGIFIHLLISYSPQANRGKLENEKELFKNLGIILLTIVIFGVIHGNTIKFDKDLIPLDELYKLGANKIDKKFDPLHSNTLLLLIYAFGFYQAYKEKQGWVIFVLPYFIASLILPYVVTLPDAGAGEIFLCANLIGAFTLPQFVDFLLKQFDLKAEKLTAFYVVLFTALSISTIMFFAFGDRYKSLLALNNKSLKYSGLQILPVLSATTVTAGDDEQPFVRFLKNKNPRNQGIFTEPQFADVFTVNTALLHILPPENITNSPIKKEVIEKSFNDYKASFLLDNKAWTDKKIHWLYMTPRLFRSILLPETRKIFLNAYLNKGVKLGLSNEKINDLANLKELYEINPQTLSPVLSENYSKLVEKLLSGSKNVPSYIQQIADSPYFGIFSSKSNDFDGDKIADIAFYNQSKKSWHIIYGKDHSEADIDLTGSLLLNQKGTDLLIPIPADYDGDSKTDIALFNRTNATWYILKSSNNSVDTMVWCSEWSEIPLPGDIDGDGKTDTSCYNSRDHRWPTFLTTSSSYHTKSFDTAPTDVTVYSDVDGDKKADYIVYRTGKGIFDIYLTTCTKETPQAGRSCGAPSTAKSTVITLGSATSRVVPADYDGDGKVDLATWTPESGKWEIAFAKDFVGKDTGSGSQSISLGKPGDIPMPADYNGDGKAEIAIYHLDTDELEIAYSNENHKKINLSKYKNYIPASFVGI